MRIFATASLASTILLILPCFTHFMINIQRGNKLINFYQILLYGQFIVMSKEQMKKMTCNNEKTPFN